METEFVFNPLTGEFDLVRKNGSGSGSVPDDGDGTVIPDQSVCFGSSLSVAEKDSSVLSNLRCYENKQNSVFDYEIKEDGEYFVIAVSSDRALADVTSNGFSIPMEEPFPCNGQNVYVSSVKLKKGIIENISITII